jgi:hypothetical protein
MYGFKPAATFAKKMAVDIGHVDRFRRVVAANR